MAGTALKCLNCQVIIRAGVMQADHANVAGAFDQVERARLLRSDIVKFNAPFAGFVKLNKQIIIRVDQVVGVHGAFFLNSSKRAFEIDAAHDRAVFNGIVHELICDTDHVQQHWFFHRHGGAEVAGDTDGCQVAGNVFVRLAGAIAEISAICAVDMNINKTGSDDAAGSVKNFRIGMRFADAVQLSVNVTFAQVEIFAENKAVFN